MTPIIDVCIKTAESTLFMGKAQSITCLNEAGPFDVLPFHENFISLINKQIVITQPGGELLTFPIQSRGILRVGSNVVTVFLGVEVVETQGRMG